jgi:hypothetical protein
VYIRKAKLKLELEPEISNPIGLSKAKYILKGDVMFIENGQRFADVCSSHDTLLKD